MVQRDVHRIGPHTITPFARHDQRLQREADASHPRHVHTARGRQLPPRIIEVTETGAPSANAKQKRSGDSWGAEKEDAA